MIFLILHGKTVINYGKTFKIILAHENSITRVIDCRSIILRSADKIARQDMLA